MATIPVRVRLMVIVESVPEKKNVPDALHVFKVNGRGFAVAGRNMSGGEGERFDGRKRKRATHTRRQYPSRGARDAESCRPTLAPASVGHFCSFAPPSPRNTSRTKTRWCGAGAYCNFSVSVHKSRSLIHSLCSSLV